MKHTKGKWECSEVMNFSDELVSFIKSGELPIAQTRGATTDGRTVEEVTANAKLIAAAPELLEELIKAKELIKEWHNMGAGDMGDGLWAIYEKKAPEMQSINNAIKKFNDGKEGS